MPDRILGLVTPDTAPGTKPSLFFSTVLADLGRIWAAAIHKGATPPAGAQEDDLWFNTAAGVVSGVGPGQFGRYKSGVWIPDLALWSKVRVVSAEPGGHYTTLSAALNALGDRAAGDEYLVLVQGHIAETAQVVAKSGVSVYGTPGSDVTSTIAGNTDAIDVNGKSNAEWRGVRFSRAGSPTSTNYAINFRGATDRTFRMVDCWLENLGTVANSGAAILKDTASPTWERCTFVGGKGTSNGTGLTQNLPGNLTDPYARHCRFLAGDAASGQNAGFGALIGGSCLGTWEDCEFLASATGTGSGLTVRDQAVPKLYRCRAVGGDDPTATVAWGVQVQGYAGPRFHYCSARGGKRSAGASHWRFDVGASAELVECSTELARSLTVSAYAAANSGRFQPGPSDPWTLMSIGVVVGVATAGATVNIGTAPGGSDILSGVSLAAISNTAGGAATAVASYKVFAAGAYLYATVVGPAAADGSFAIHTKWITAYGTCNALYWGASGRLRVEGGSFVSNPASDALYILNPDVRARNVTARRCTFEALRVAAGGTQMASLKGSVAGASGSYPELLDVTLVGPVSGITLPSVAGQTADLPPGIKYVFAPPGWNQAWLAAYANAQVSAPAWIDWIGNSIMIGFTPATDVTDVTTQAVWAQVRQLLINDGSLLHGDFWPAWVNKASHVGPPNSTANVPLTKVGTSTATLPTTGFAWYEARDWALRLVQNVDASGSLTYVTPYACTQVDIVYVHWTNKVNAWQYQVDGGAWVDVSTDGSKNQDRIRLTGLSNATHTIVVRPNPAAAANDCSIAGFASYNDPTKGVGFAVIARSGDTGSFYAVTTAAGKPVRYFSGPDASGPNHFGFPTQPQLAVIEMITNDVGADPTNYAGGPDQFEWALKLLIESLRYGTRDCSILFLVPAMIGNTYSDQNTSQVNPVQYAHYVARIDALAREYNCAVIHMAPAVGQHPVADNLQQLGDQHPAIALLNLMSTTTHTTITEAA